MREGKRKIFSHTELPVEKGKERAAHSGQSRKESMMLRRLIIVVILTIATTPAFAKHEAIEVLADKIEFSSGICAFKGSEFKFFAKDFALAPESLVDKYEQCKVFVGDATLNPIWLLLLDEDGEPKEVIEWRESGLYKTVWRTGLQI